MTGGFRNTSLIDRLRCGETFASISIDDPIFDPIRDPMGGQDCVESDCAEDAGECAQEDVGYVKHKRWITGANNSNGPIRPQNRSGAIAGSTGSVPGTSPSSGDFILIARDAVGAISVIGPFQDEDDAFQYVINNHICDGFWVNVTTIQRP